MTKTDKKKKEEGTLTDDLELETPKSEKKKTKTSAKQNDGSVSLSVTKISLVLKLLENIKENNEQLMQLLSSVTGDETEARISLGQMSDDGFQGGQTIDEDDIEGRIIEGVFDGENMIGPDGKQYSVPANYASKSKLVEGDILKLTITGSGTFVYKQIGPIERRRVMGNLEMASNGNYFVISDGKKWRVLTASVTYFKGGDGDETVILVPRAGESKWAAVENVVKKAT
jgi:hypothetical protein